MKLLAFFYNCSFFIFFNPSSILTNLRPRWKRDRPTLDYQVLSHPGIKQYTLSCHQNQPSFQSKSSFLLWQSHSLLHQTANYHNYRITVTCIFSHGNQWVRSDAIMTLLIHNTPGQWFHMLDLNAQARYLLLYSPVLYAIIASHPTISQAVPVSIRILGTQHFQGHLKHSVVTTRPSFLNRILHKPL